jgi:hypothetical protein
MLAVVAIAALVSIGLWFAMRGAQLADVELLPARCRRRVRWWQANALHVQVGCGIVAAAAVGMQISGTVG